MLESLIALDKEIFFSINQGWSNSFLDWLMPILRNPYTWAPLYLFIIVFSIRNYKKYGAYIILGLLLNFSLSDGISSHVVKKTVQRIRPCNDIEVKEFANVRVRCGSGFSFTSSHATNHFAMAIFLIGVFYRKWKPVLPLALIWAATISLAQVYVGVHYFGDILCGAILGSLIGWFSVSIFKKTINNTNIRI